MTQEPVEGGPEATGEERRRDSILRRQIKELLSLIREFYTTCHMVAVGQLEPSKAKAKARIVEDKLRAMMAETLERLEETGEEDDDGEANSDWERAAP